MNTYVSPGLITGNLTEPDCCNETVLSSLGDRTALCPTDREPVITSPVIPNQTSLCDTVHLPFKLAQIACTLPVCLC